MKRIPTLFYCFRYHCIGNNDFQLQTSELTTMYIHFLLFAESGSNYNIHAWHHSSRIRILRISKILKIRQFLRIFKDGTDFIFFYTFELQF